MSFKAVLEADISNWQSNLNKAGAQLEAFDRKVKEQTKGLRYLGDSFINVGKKASILSVAVAAAGAKAFSMAADFQDALGATEQIFKDNSDTVQNWANNLDTSYGIAKKEALEYSNLMGSMLINIGNLTEKEASKQSAKLIELAGDLTAMYGGTTQDAVRALTGALKGNNTMLDNYGMAVNEALIKQKALELGLISGTSEMSLQAKQAATLALIWEQTGAAQGQAAREADGASGAMRKFRTEVSNLSTELGEVLLPIITPIISKLSDFVGSLRTLSPEMQSMIVGIAGVTAVAGPLLVVIGSILKALPLLKAGFVALTGPIGAIAVTMTVVAVNFHKNIEALKTDWDYLLDYLRTTSAGIGDLLSGNFSGWWEKVQLTWRKNIEYLKVKLRQLKEYYTGVDEIKLDQTALEAALAANEMTGSAGAMQAVKKEVDNLNESLEETKDIAKLDTFQKLIGEQLNVRDAITKTTATIEDLQSKLVKLQTGILPSTNVRQELAETQQQINDLSTALDLLTGKRELNIDVKTNISGIEAAENKFLKDGAIVVPPIDTSLLENSLGQAKEMVATMSLDLGSLLSAGISSFAQTIGDAFAGNWDGLGAGLLKAVGSLAQQFGGLIVGMGVAALELQTLITNPLTAIAAGAALIALGALASKAAQNMMKSATTGGGYSSAPSLRNTGPSYGPSDYRGQYQDDFKVEFKIGTNELVGVLDTAEQRRNRIG